MLQRSASRNPNRSLQRGGHDVGAGLLRRRHDDHAGRPAARDQVTQQLGELLALLAVGQREVVGELVAHHEVQREPVTRSDLALSAGEQLAVARVHHVAHRAQQRDRFVSVGAGELLGDGRPSGELDELSVQQPHASCRGPARRPRPAAIGRRTCRRRAHRRSARCAPPGPAATGWPCSSTPTGTVSHSDTRSASACGQGSEAVCANGSRRTIETAASAPSAGSRTTRTSRTRRHAASCSRRASSSETEEPRRTRTLQQLTRRNRRDRQHARAAIGSRRGPDVDHGALP